MAEAATEYTYNSLEEFLDTLPKKPCESHPANRYFCSVCERLNKPVARRCEYSKFQSEGGETELATDKPIQFLQLSEDSGTPSQELVNPPGEGDSIDKVEFKVISPMQSDEDYPLIEFVQPKDKKIEPIEMELLEDVAIEFSLTGDEAVEVEAIEVAPIEDDEEVLEEEEMVEGVEVDALEVEAVEAEVDERAEMVDSKGKEGMKGVPEFKPITDKPITKAKITKVKQKEPKTIVKQKKKTVKKPRKKSKKKPLKKPTKKAFKHSPKKIKHPAPSQPEAKPEQSSVTQPVMQSGAQAQTKSTVQPGATPAAQPTAQPAAQPAAQPTTQSMTRTLGHTTAQNKIHFRSPSPVQPQTQTTAPAASTIPKVANPKKKVVKKITKKKVAK